MVFLESCPTVARNASCVSLSPFDFFSIAHILWGVLFFMVISLLYTKPRFLKTFYNIMPVKIKHFIQNIKLIHCLLIAVAFGILWEPFENSLLFWIGLKTKQDSIINMFTDIICWSSGALISFIMAYLIFVTERVKLAFYLFGVIFTVLWITIFLILGYLTIFNLFYIP